MFPHEFLVQFALGYVGVTELTGHNDGPEVEMFQRAVDMVAAGEPWCMCFAQFCIQQTEQQYGFVAPIMRSEHCLTVWQQSQPLVVFPPYPGCLALWIHPGTTKGHVGIVTGVDLASQTFSTVEGNTSAGPGLDRDGGGVYEKIRSLGGEPGFMLLGFLDPFLGVV